MKILLLENDARCREETGSYLKGREFDVVSFENGRELIDSVNLNDFDLALLDIEAPDIDGLEVLDYINRMEIDLPVIFISGLATEDVIAKAFGRGCEDFIRKPFLFKELELRIVKALRRKLKNSEVDLDKNSYFDIIYRELYVNGKPVKMTSIQKKIVYQLVKNRGNVVEYEKMYDYIWDGKDVSKNALASHIRDVRKLLPDGIIKSVSKLGYRLDAK